MKLRQRQLATGDRQTDGRTDGKKHRRLGTQAQDRRNSNETTIEPKFEISTLKNPGVPNFIEIGQLFFSQFRGYGTHPPKKRNFLAKNCSDQNFEAIFEISTLGNPRVPNFIKIEQL